MKTLERLKKDPRVSDVWSEGDEGYWILLSRGWMCKDTDCHAVHEHTIKSLLRSFKSVQKCECKDCKPYA